MCVNDNQRAETKIKGKIFKSYAIQLFGKLNFQN
jgi:hypothetical protein